MRSLFWKFLLSAVAAIALVAMLTFLLGRLSMNERTLLNLYPGLGSYARQWVESFEAEGGRAAADAFSRRQLQQHQIRLQVFDASGRSIAQVGGWNPAAQDEQEPRFKRLTQEFHSEKGNDYVFFYFIPNNIFFGWQAKALLLPIVIVSIVICMLLLSLGLAFNVTRPIQKLRCAVSDLSETNYHSEQLAQIRNRNDEIGMLASDFSQMGERLQTLIASQRQLLRDVSHELRSPLARLRISLAMLERKYEDQQDEEAQPMWQRTYQECERLDRLIGEILTYSRLDFQDEEKQELDLNELVMQIADMIGDARIQVEIPEELLLMGWEERLDKAISNLIINASRFSPEDQPIEVSASLAQGWITLRIQDHGPGCSDEVLVRLAEPFFRAPNQASKGYGLGLAIAKRAVANHGGTLAFSVANPTAEQRGFVATIRLPQGEIDQEGLV